MLTVTGKAVQENNLKTASHDVIGHLSKCCGKIHRQTVADQPVVAVREQLLSAGRRQDMPPRHILQPTEQTYVAGTICQELKHRYGRPERDVAAGGHSCDQHCEQRRQQLVVAHQSAQADQKTGRWLAMPRIT